MHVEAVRSTREDFNFSMCLSIKTHFEWQDTIKVIGNILDNCIDQKERDFLGDCLVKINNGQYYEDEI